VAQQRRALGGVHDDGALRNLPARCGVHRCVQAHGIVQHTPCQHGHRVGHRGREHQRLALGRQLGQQAADLVGKAQVEQAVGLVEHQGPNLGQTQRMLLQQIEQAPWRAHHQVRTAAQRQHLRVDRQPTDRQHHRQFWRQVTRSLRNLRRQLARRRHDQHTQAARPLCQHPGNLGQAVQQWEQKRCRLAGTGGRQSEHVPTLQHNRDGRGLDGRGFTEAFAQQWSQAFVQSLPVGIWWGLTMSFVVRPWMERLQLRPAAVQATVEDASMHPRR
jgi:hypothetical protein